MDRLQKNLPKILLAASAALFFLPLGTRALWDSDEGRYAEIAREMLQLKDWVSPHLNYVLYFEKPPLMYWLTALSQTVFGQNAFAARFWCAVFALLTVGVTYSFGKRWKSERTGLLAGAILASSVLFFALSQYLVLDMALTFWMTLELFAFSRMVNERSPAVLRRYAVLLALAAAGGMLTKGPVALVLPGAAFFLTTIYARSNVSGSKVSWKAPIFLFVALTAPWFVLVSLRHPFFIPFFFVREHVARYFTNVHQRSEPLYFFILVLIGGFFPWIVFLPKILQRWLGGQRAAMRRDPVGALLVVWAVFITLFFSLSHSQLAGYILPVFPALALLTAEAFDDAFNQTPLPRWTQGGVIGLIACFIGALALLKWPPPPEFLTEEPVRTLVVHSGGLALAMGIGVFILVGVWGMRRMPAVIGGILVAQLLFLSSAASLAPALDPWLSARALALTLRERSQPQDKIIGYGVSYENRLQTLLYYTGCRLIVMGDPGELAMGQAHEPESAVWFSPEEAKQQALLSMPDGVWGVTDTDHWKELENAGVSDHFAVIEKQGALLLFQKIQ